MDRLDFEEIDTMLKTAAPLRKFSEHCYRVDMIIKKTFHAYVMAENEEEAAAMAKEQAKEGDIEEDWSFDMEDDDINVWKVEKNLRNFKKGGIKNG